MFGHSVNDPKKIAPSMLGQEPMLDTLVFYIHRLQAGSLAAKHMVESL